MTAFLGFCKSAGLIPKHIEADGKWHRCATESHPKSRNGAFKLAMDGSVGFAQDWAVHAEPLIWHADSAAPAKPIDHAAIARRRAEERRRTADAIRAARQHFDDSQRLREGHPYLRAKHLDMLGCHGLRIDDGGWLVVPISARNTFASLQRISPTGEKRFWPGAPTKGGYYIIERRDAVLTVLCEGLATGLAIFAATPTARVIVAFNAGNMPRVAESFPFTGMVAVAADNDLATEHKSGVNPGVSAAQASADIIGCGTAVPDGITGTDWLDYRNEKVADRLQLRRRQSESAIRRGVDAEINAAMMRAAKFVGEVEHAR